MAYSEEKKEECFNWLIEWIESGNSLISGINTNGMPSTSTFYEWLDSDPEKAKRYARACENRELLILDEILEIADKQDSDVIEVNDQVQINHNIINRNRLQVDTRKWVLSKLNPKKYGEKTDITSGGKEISTTTTVLFNSNPLALDDDKGNNEPTPD